MESGIVLARGRQMPELHEDSWSAIPIVDVALGPTMPEALSRGSLLQPMMDFSTTGLPARSQFEAWREYCGPAIEMIEPLGAEISYSARCRSWKFGSFVLSTVRAPAARYRRTHRQLHRDALDPWVISITRHGTHSMSTEAGTSTAPVGLPYIFSLADAFEGERSDIDWLCLFVSRETFPKLGLVIDRCRQLPLESGLGQLLACYLEAVSSQLSKVTVAELPRLVAATRAMIAACVTPSAEGRENATIQLGWARRERVRQVIRQHLRSSRLTPNRLCRMVGMSRSQLYRLFEPSGGVARYIQTERLREAHRTLSDATTRRDIHEVAEDLGFFDASAFSRAFRREFGCTPTDVRIAALAGERNGPVHRPAVSERPGEPLNLSAMLRQL